LKNVTCRALYAALLMKSLIESFLAPEARLPRWWLPLVLVVLAVMGVIFWKAACEHGDTINKDVFQNDQKVYINMAAAFKDTGYNYFVPRMRMPLYGLMLSPFHRTGASLEECFPVARRLNTAFALLFIGIIAVVLRLWLGWGLATVLALLSGSTFYMAKAGYVQPEGMLVMIIGITCAMIAEFLRKPVWWKGIVIGLLLCAWHMTKASGPAILAAFFTAWSLKMIWPQGADRRRLLLGAALVPVFFVLPMTPYVLNNVKIFGSPFYNTQSKYFMWCESTEEKHQIQKMPISYQPATPEQLAGLPTAKKYLAKHPLSELKKRLKKGYKDMMRNVWEQHREMMMAASLCFSLLLLVICLYPRKAWEMARYRVVEIAFAVMVIFGFGLLYAWMQPLRVGPRMIASIHLAAMFFCLLWLREIVRGEVWRVRGMTLSVERVIVALLVPVWIFLTALLLSVGMKETYYGG
jgi:hypothetical protein